MSKVKILKVTPNATSSQASEGGLLRLKWPDGRKTETYGQVPVPASHSAGKAHGERKKMNAICGQNLDASSNPAALQQSLENRLHQILDGTGYAGYALTWKHWGMKSGAPICALRASARHTSGNVFGGLPTPQATDNGKYEMTKHTTLGKSVFQKYPTPCREDAHFNTSKNHRHPPLTRHFGMSLNPPWVAWLMGFPSTWDACAPTVMLSSLKSPPRLSGHSWRQKNED